MKLIITIILFGVFTSCDNHNELSFDKDLLPNNAHDDSIKSSEKAKSVLLKITNINKSTTTATGFFVKYKNKEYFLTNWHVLTGREATNLAIKTHKPDYLVTLTTSKNEVPLYFPVKDNKWIEYRDSTGLLFDIVAISYEAPFPIDANKFVIDYISNNQDEKDSCIIIGFPRSLLKDKDLHKKPIMIKAKYNVIGSENFQYLLKNLYSNGTFITWNNKMENGISGSPVFSLKMNLIGIYSTKFHQIGETKSSTLDYGFFWNISAIKKLLDNGKRVDWSKSGW